MKIQEMDVEDFKTLVKQTIDESFENHIEDLEALASQNYLKNIKESREEYLKNEIFNLEDLDV